MIRYVLAVSCITILMTLSVYSQSIDKSDLRRIEQWKHDTEAFGREFYSFVDDDGHVIGSFYKSPFRIISADKIVLFAPYGQGPSDLVNAMGVFKYKGDLAIVEMSNKIKVFTKKGGTYVWKATKWLKTGRYPQMIKSATYFDNKLFLAGIATLSGGKNKVEEAKLTIYNDNGKPLKTLFRETVTVPSRLYMMRYHVTGYKTGIVLFLQENRLKVSIISSKDLVVSGEKNLEAPNFYKKMPKDFYVFKQYKGKLNELRKDLETWSMEYSAINKVVIDGDYLVVQVRTCSENLKKFALLFYNGAKNFKLEKTVLIDDYLLGTRNGRYYCFANGNPGRDIDTDECIINIYEFKNEYQASRQNR
jgi:hypothetical protein